MDKELLLQEATARLEGEVRSNWTPYGQRVEIKSRAIITSTDAESRDFLAGHAHSSLHYHVSYWILLSRGKLPRAGATFSLL